MSFFSFSKKRASRATLILDIGSKSVGGAIYQKTDTGGAKLLYTGREQIAFQKELKGERLLAVALNSLSTLLVHIEKYGIEHLVEKVVLVVSSPWHASETKTLSLKLPKPTVITKAMVDELLSEEEKLFEEKKKSENQEVSYEVFERKIIEMRLNGYPTATPYGKIAERLDIHLFGSIISSTALSEIRKTVQRHFPVESFFYHTFSAVAFASLRDHFSELQSFLVIQVGGEVTDITIIKKGLIVETVSFPLGHNGLLRSLEEICGLYPHCTLEAVLSLHKGAKIDNYDRAKVETAIANTKKSWLGYFDSAIANFSEETFLPKDVFLFEEVPYASVFEEFLREASAGQFTITAEPFVVKVIDQTAQSLFSEIGKGVQSDPILSMEARFSARVDG